MALSPHEKQRRFRARMRKRGMRSVQLWVPNRHDPLIADELCTEARLIAHEPVDQDLNAIIDDALAELDRQLS